jgi:hypothetical protein
MNNSDSAEPAKNFDAVFIDELADIATRREVYGVNRDRTAASAAEQPTPEHEQVEREPSEEPGQSVARERISEKAESAAQAPISDSAAASQPLQTLTGLALSGGGIRSATFCLGFLQGLNDLNLLPAFDYLSTVSGGGFVGGWWSAWLAQRSLFPRGQTTVVPLAVDVHVRLLGVATIGQ